MQKNVYNYLLILQNQNTLIILYDLYNFNVVALYGNTLSKLL